MNVYEIVTEKIVEQLEQGVVPWKQPWGWPRNFVTRQEYRGINVILLACKPVTSPYWMTFKQAQSQGGRIKKGAKGSPVVFFNWIEEDKDGQSIDPYPVLKYYLVFNGQDVEGIEFPKPETGGGDAMAACEAVVNEMSNAPKLQHEVPRAYYHPRLDIVNMPQKALFDNEQGYYATLFHELTHSTGHASRLNRHKEEGADCHFGSEPYAREELVAEIGSAFLCAKSGIANATIENHSAYVASWIKALKDDKRLIVTAASQAQKAVDYILGQQSPRAEKAAPPARDAELAEVRR